MSKSEKRMARAIGKRIVETLNGFGGFSLWFNNLSPELSKHIEEEIGEVALKETVL
jgi:hypothetical protein